MIDKSTIKRLVHQSGGRIGQNRHYEFEGTIFYPSDSYYFDNSTQLESFSQAVIEDYKASLVPVGYYVGVETEYGYDLIDLDKAIPIGIELYALGNKGWYD